MGQDIPTLPSFSIGIEVLEVTDHFTYLGSTITITCCLTKVYKTIAKAAGDLAKLCKIVWDNNQLTLNTKLR